MRSGTLSIRTIFGQPRRHLVPLYQRPYVWQQEQQWEPLWDDIRNLAERILRAEQPRPHFLGAIVLDQVRNPTGYVESRWIIDGQQRLTTIQIVLESLSDICHSLEQRGYASALKEMTRNPNHMGEPEEVEFKVWPTNSDRAVFRDVMKARSPAELHDCFRIKKGAKSIGNNIGDAYLFFHRVMSEWLEPCEDGFIARLDALFRALSDSVRMVVIDLESDDDAQLIFETLNARGTPLLPSDLIKNFIFHHSQQVGGDMQSLYQKYWVRFDESADFWREEVKAGRLMRARIDTFFQHFLTMVKMDEINVAHLYGAFKSYAVAATTGRSIEAILSDIHEYASIFERFGSIEAPNYHIEFFKTLDVLETTTVYPLLLGVFSRNTGQHGQIKRIMADIESFLVRRTICQLTTKGYNKIFLDLLGAMSRRTSGDDADRVREFLISLEGESSRWPDDDEFKKAWLEDPLYERMKRSRLLMVLERLNSAFTSDKSELVDIPGRLTIEHLMPQKWHTNWELETDRDEADRNRIIHTIGNLTILTDKLNPAVSNSDWRAKVRQIRRYTKLDLNRYFLDQDVWNEDEIIRRGKMLFGEARKIWKYPKE